MLNNKRLTKSQPRYSTVTILLPAHPALISAYKILPRVASIHRIVHPFRRRVQSNPSNQVISTLYYQSMPANPQPPSPLGHALRALIEVAFIIFLFYSNLLMGEFNRTNGTGKSFSVALYDIFTIKNFAIAIVAASIGYVIFERLRKQL